MISPVLVNDSLGKKCFDQTCRISEAFESFARMFSVHRRRMDDGGRSARKLEREPDHFMGTPGLIGDFVEQSGKLNLRVGKYLIELVNRTAGDAGSVQKPRPIRRPSV